MALDAEGREWALKLPTADLAGNARELDRFATEEWVARRVDSPHVIKAAPAETKREHLFTAVEFIHGQTLAQWMTDHPRPALDEVRNLADQIGRGLQALHRKEMLHQDLRPENLMIDRQGTVILIDLASAHVAGLSEGLGDARALELFVEVAEPAGLERGLAEASDSVDALLVGRVRALRHEFPELGEQVRNGGQGVDEGALVLAQRHDPGTRSEARIYQSCGRMAPGSEPLPGP